MAQGNTNPILSRGLLGGFCAKPDLTCISSPSIPAFTVSTAAKAIPCADKPVVLVAVSVITVAEFSGHVPLLSRANALSTVTGALARALQAVR